MRYATEDINCHKMSDYDNIAFKTDHLIIYKSVPSLHRT